MDGHVDAVAVLVDNLDHLLIPPTTSIVRVRGRCRHSYQTAELTHTVIDMHDIVAYLKLLYLLQSQRHLAATGFVALQVVLVESVEYLVIGKDTDTQIVVSKALMQGLFDRRK